MDFIIRSTLPSDYDVVSDIGTKNYPEQYYEGLDSFKSKIIGYPSGSFVASKDSFLCGYIISFPYLLGRFYPINEFYSAVNNPDCYYIHDLCVSPEYRNNKIAKSLVNSVLNHDYEKTALVAVMGSSKFWEKIGFVKEKTINYYGSPAEYMIRVSKHRL